MLLSRTAPVAPAVPEPSALILFGVGFLITRRPLLRAELVLARRENDE